MKPSEYGYLWRRFRRNKGAVFGLGVFIAIVFMALFADFIAPYNPLEQNYARFMEGPSADHWLGTDSFGRDMLSRIIYGARIALIVGIVAVIGNAAIIVRHVLPNVLAPVIVQGALRVSAAIITEAGLSFLGLGQQPPTPVWGSMIAEGRNFIIMAPQISTFPGIALMITVVGLNLLGDGLRDTLDPKLKT
jgi:ABC-type dipeptide/oligopeptide/nickel transport system permease subunit